MIIIFIERGKGLNNERLKDLEKRLQIAQKEIEKKRGLSDLDKIKLQISRTEGEVEKIKDEESIKMSFSLLGILIGGVSTLSPWVALAGLGIGKLLDDGAEQLGVKSKMSLLEILKTAPRSFINLVNYSYKE